MKVLLINKYHFVKGGSEVYTFGLKQMLIENGHEVIDFSMTNEKNGDSKYKEYFVDEINYINSGISNKIKNSAKLIYSREAYKKLKKLIADTKPDIAHVNLIYHQLTPSIFHALKEMNIPIVFTSHDYKIVCPNYKLYNKTLCDKCISGSFINCTKYSCHKNSKVFSLLLSMEAYLHKYLKSYELVDKIICPSKFMLDKLAQKGIEKAKLRLVPNFINPVYYEESKKNTSTEKTRDIVFYGRLSEEKGLLNLLEAAKILKNKVSIKIIGKGPQEEELLKYVEQHNLTNVKFLGFMNGEKLYKEISTAYCTVIPAIWHEVFGLTIIESYAFGTPVIGANLGGISEIIKHRKTGYLFDNVKELANSIKEILDLTPNEYEKMKHNCLEESKEYAPDKIYNQIIQVYDEVLKK